MMTLKAAWEFLKGKKTYIAVVVGIVMAGLYGQGYISEQVYVEITGLLGMIGLATVRHAITK